MLGSSDSPSFEASSVAFRLACGATVRVDFVAKIACATLLICINDCLAVLAFQTRLCVFASLARVVDVPALSVKWNLDLVVL